MTKLNQIVNLINNPLNASAASLNVLLPISSTSGFTSYNNEVCELFNTLDLRINMDELLLQYQFNLMEAVYADIMTGANLTTLEQRSDAAASDIKVIYRWFEERKSDTFLQGRILGLGYDNDNLLYSEEDMIRVTLRIFLPMWYIASMSLDNIMFAISNEEYTKAFTECTDEEITKAFLWSRAFDQLVDIYGEYDGGSDEGELLNYPRDPSEQRRVMLSLIDLASCCDDVCKARH